MTQLKLNLSSELENILPSLAQRLGRSVESLAEQALQEYVARHQLEEKRHRETLAALDSVKNGELVDGDEVFRWMDSWGTPNELPPPTP